MPPKRPHKKMVALSIAFEAPDRAKCDKAAKILNLPTSVWLRALGLKEADRIIAEARAAK